MLNLKAWCYAAWLDSRRRVALGAILVALFSVLLYANSLDNQFIWDGKETFLDDPSIRDFKYLPSYFTGAVVSEINKEGGGFGYLSYYRPLTRIMHLLEYQAFGTKPVGYHVVSILLNAGVVALAFMLINAITGNALLALLAALLFAAHPNHHEAVSWAYSDSYLLFSLFALSSMLGFWRRRYVLSLLAFGLALLSQESAVLLPLILVLMRALLQESRQWRDYVAIVPFLALVAVFLVVRSVAVGSVPVTDLGLVTLLNAAVSIIALTVKVFFIPDGAITLYYYQPGMFDALTGKIALSYVVTVLLLAASVWLWRKNKQMLFWLWWNFVWIVVMFNVGRFAEFYFMDKILYLSSLGGCVLLAWGLLAMPFKQSIQTVFAGVVLCAFVGMNLWRASYWNNEQVYFEQAVKFAPDFPLLRYATANMYRDIGDFERAKVEYEATVRLQPSHSYAFNNLGNLYFMGNEFERAKSAWEKALQSDASNPQPYYNIGVVLERQGRVAEALEYYGQYLRRQPSPPPAAIMHIRQLQQR